MMRFKRQAGDTMIEVLLAIMVLGAVLASSLALSNRAGRAGLSAYERTEAVNLMQTQVELVRAVHKLPGYSAEAAAIRGTSAPSTIDDFQGEGAANFPTGTCVYFDQDTDTTVTENKAKVATTSLTWAAKCGPDNGNLFNVYTYLEDSNTSTFRTVVLWQGIGAEGNQIASTRFRVRE